MPPANSALPHATALVDDWIRGWKDTGRLVLLLDFDGTLAPIVDRPELAALPEPTGAALRRLAACGGVDIAVVSGRGLSDARERVGLTGIAYAGNHGMEIEGAGLRRVHQQAEAARPKLDKVAADVERGLAGLEGAIVEHKGLTLSVHYRLVPEARWPEVSRTVREVAEGTGLRLTEGKRVIEVRPAVDWHKGRAVEFLLDNLRPPPGAPVIYLGDDRTDEDAFRALAGARRGAGVLVAEAVPEDTQAMAFLRDPHEVGALLQQLADQAS